MSTTTAGVPKDYSELFSMYRTYVETLISQLGVAPENKEDVASDIFLKLYERDIIGMFDVNHQGWQGRQVKFKTFLSAFVLSYARGMRDRAYKYRMREPLLCDTIIRNHWGGGLMWIAVYGPSSEDTQFLIYENQEAERTLVARLRQRLSEIERPKTRCDLLELFDEAVRLVRRDGVLSYAELSATLGVNIRSVRSWMKWIAGQLREEAFAR